MKISYSLIKIFFLVVGIVFVLIYFLFSLPPLVCKWIGIIGFLFLGIGVVLFIYFPQKYSTKPQFISELIIKNVTISGKKFNFLTRIVFGASLVSFIVSFSIYIHGIWVDSLDFNFIMFFLKVFWVLLMLYFFIYLWTMMFYSSRKKKQRKKEIRKAHTSEISDWLSHNEYIINDENIHSFISLISDFELDSRKNIDVILKAFPEVQNQFPEIMKKVKKEVRKVKSGKERNQNIVGKLVMIMVLFWLVATIISALHFG